MSGHGPLLSAGLAQACFLRACALDVAVRKPGNVSLASPGHGMQAAQFLASARAAAEGLFRHGAPVGERIAAAVAASWQAAGCNTNLGIVLLCTPVARAVELEPGPHTASSLRRAVESVLAGLDVDDAAAAFRGIAQANPGGLGRAEAQDVHEAPSVTLREAMALAAGRDLIARQYDNGYAELFELGLASLPADFLLEPENVDAASADASTTAAVQGLYLALLACLPDSHIVRKHGEAVAQNVMRAAQGFAAQAAAGRMLAADPAFAAWDEALKQQGINPGTTADLTVAALLLAGLSAGEEGAPAAPR